MTIYIVLLFFIYLNQKTISRVSMQYKPFESTSKIRNVDVLIIGDMADFEGRLRASESYVQICAPHRGVNSCYEILRHTHSVLRDGGSVYICLNRKFIKKPISNFDVCFFHPVTISRLSLQREKKNAQIPLAVNPFESAIILLDWKSKKYTETDYAFETIDKFCRERGYQVKYFIK